MIGRGTERFTRRPNMDTHANEVAEDQRRSAVSLLINEQLRRHASMAMGIKVPRCSTCCGNEQDPVTTDISSLSLRPLELTSNATGPARTDPLGSSNDNTSAWSGATGKNASTPSPAIAALTSSIAKFSD